MSLEPYIIEDLLRRRKRPQWGDLVPLELPVVNHIRWQDPKEEEDEEEESGSTVIIIDMFDYNEHTS